MNERPSTADSPEAGDWLDALLARDAAEHADRYIEDDGFTANVMRALPAVIEVPAWRRPFVTGIWLMAATLLAIALPETALDLARGAVKLFAAQPFSLSTLAVAIAALAIAAWTAAAMALRRA